jgi:hypothetical protein
MIEVLVIALILIIVVVVISVARKQTEEPEAQFAMDQERRTVKIKFDPVVKVYDLPMTKEDVEARRSVMPSFPVRNFTPWEMV